MDFLSFQILLKFDFTRGSTHPHSRHLPPLLDSMMGSRRSLQSDRTPEPWQRGDSFCKVSAWRWMSALLPSPLPNGRRRAVYQETILSNSCATGGVQEPGALETDPTHTYVRGWNGFPLPTVQTLKVFAPGSFPCAARAIGKPTKQQGHPFSVCSKTQTSPNYCLQTP